MGMDIIELVMITEEEFDIRIPNKAASQLETVRDLAFCVASRVERSRARYCRTQQAFHTVRRVLARLDLPRGAVAPQTNLYALEPIFAHKDVWPLVGKALGVGASEWPRVPATNLPYGLRTPGEMARHVATCQLTKTAGPWTSEEVLLRVRQLVTQQLEVYSFSDNARFINDLGAA